MPVVELVEGLMSGGNPYFSAGFGLVGLATGMTLLRQGYRQFSVVARRKFLVTLEIPSRDMSYHWMLNWISTVGSSNSQHLSVKTQARQLENGKMTTEFDLIPSPGIHYFQHGGRWFRVMREREKGPGDMNSGNPFETVTLTTLGTSRKVFEGLLAEAKALAYQREMGKTVIYTPWGSEWRQFGFPRRPRPLSSVILDGNLGEHLKKDVLEFIDNSQWYIDRGIPYRRGYLLHGPPGTGKSSYIMALAGELGYNICMINLSESGLTDDRLAHLLAHAPQKSLTLLEDIDAAGVVRDNQQRGVSFSGLLNVLDGVASTEERLVFMTTNRIDALDPALIRPGRIDVQQHIGLASRGQQARLFAKFFPEATDMAEEFADQLAPDAVSMAELQGYLMVHKNQPRTAIKHAAVLLDQGKA